ncbi:heavy metal-associated isoprenylated plant protein 47-like [Argentina anserina]|uniref:heavy metal-associated isoprenylated plant protein 47-like n=1 Tax=Argentina anserina TaxID=57926 RepID=UPI00217690A3|nr:heavy metal-associated isoprenylated plant protein 47-like [Potentilla anserina]
MVQQKIVMKGQMCSEKCRTKGLKIAAVAKGVSKVSIEAEKDHVEVIGNGIDSMTLTMTIRKKVGHADIVSIEEVKAEEEDKPVECIPITCISSYGYPHYPQYVVHEEPTTCSIM